MMNFTVEAEKQAKKREQNYISMLNCNKFDIKKAHPKEFRLFKKAEKTHEKAISAFGLKQTENKNQ